MGNMCLVVCPSVFHMCVRVYGSGMTVDVCKMPLIFMFVCAGVLYVMRIGLFDPPLLLFWYRPLSLFLFSLLAHMFRLNRGIERGRKA